MLVGVDVDCVVGATEEPVVDDVVPPIAGCVVVASGVLEVVGEVVVVEVVVVEVVVVVASVHESNDAVDVLFFMLPSITTAGAISCSPFCLGISASATDAVLV